MSRLLQFLGSKRNKDCALYDNAAHLFEGLKQEAPDAIRCLSARIVRQVYAIGRQYKLSVEDTEELYGDAIAILLEKIRDGRYVFQGYDPATYAIEIARQNVFNLLRRANKHNNQDLNEALVHNIAAEETDWSSREQTELLKTLLSRLGDNCQKLIRLKYIDEWRDKDIVDQGLTQYTTVDALKNHRAKCMKKLIELGKSIKF
jgi:RNA polymerase sigma factor (sigma-70 family)